MVAFALGALALVGVGAGCRAGGPAESLEAPDGAYLQQAGMEWDALFNARRPIQLAALYAEDAVSMPFNRPNLNGRQA